MQACHKALYDQYSSYESKDSAMGQIASASMMIGDNEIWRESVEKIVRGFPTASFAKIGGLISSQRSKILLDQ